MTASLHIAKLTELPIGIEGLRIEAAREGFRFMDKLIAEWRSGVNRFDKPGEVLLGAFRTDGLAGIGGLNHDTYTAQVGIGRLRHLFVRESARRSGTGTALVRELLNRAEGGFHSVRLRTKTREGADFYARLGFHAVQSETATHAWTCHALEAAGVIFIPANGDDVGVRLRRSPSTPPSTESAA